MPNNESVGKKIVEELEPAPIGLTQQLVILVTVQV